MRTSLLWLFPGLLLGLILLWLQGSYERMRVLQMQVSQLQRELDTFTPPQAASRPPLKPEALPKVYTWLVRQAEQQGLRLVRLEPQDAMARLVLEGGFASVFQFLKSMERPPFALWIERYSLIPTVQSAQELQLEILVGVEVQR